MEIKQLDLVSFGHFQEKSLHFEQSRINVIFGLNEAGKSTVFEGLKTILSGYTPASRDRFLYVPWGENRAFLRAVLWDGSEITRTLRSSASGELLTQGKLERIQNNPLFGLERSLIENLYTITAEDLLSIDTKSMEKVFEELMTTLDEEGLKTPPEAIKGMEDKLKGLYSNRKSSTRQINELEKQIEAVGTKLQLTQEHEAIYKEDEKLLQETTQRRTAIEEELRACETEYRRALDQDAKRHLFEETTWHHRERSEKLGSDYLDQVKARQREWDDASRNYRFAKEKLEESRENHASNYRDEDLSPLEADLQALKSLEHSLEKKEQQMKREKKLLESLEERYQSRFKRHVSDSMDKPVNFSWIFLILAVGFGVLFGLNLFNRILLGVLAGVSLVAFLLSLWYSALRQGLYARAQELQEEYMETKTQLDGLREEYGEEETTYQKLISRTGSKGSDDLQERIYLKRDQKKRALEEEAILRNDEDALVEIEQKLRTAIEDFQRLAEPLEVYHQDYSVAIGYLEEDLKQLELLDRFREQEDRSLDSKALAAKREELLEKRNQLLEQSHRATERMQRTLQEESSESLRDEKSALVAKKKEKVLDYNRLQLLKGYLEDSYRHFVEEHQPQLLQKASIYLSQFTGGRYVGLLSSETREMLLRGTASELIPLTSSHSKGTRNQVYLALRLAVMESIEAESLPLFLDEAFSNWDQGRLQSTLESLEEVSKGRQIFVFTCRDDVLQQLEEHTTCSIQRL